MNFIDLFSGTGAFSIVLSKHGNKCVFANDSNVSSSKIYDCNHSLEHFKCKDIHDIEVSSIPEHSILCAGFPCQPFSIAGQQRGFADSRSNVFWKIVDILRVHRPSIIILENVKNLTSHDKGNTFQIIINALQEIGYFVKWEILDTCKLTPIPHHRERIYMVGFTDPFIYNRFVFPSYSGVLNKKIIDYLDIEVDDKYYYTNKLKVYEQIEKEVNKNIREFNTLYQYRRYYVRENKNGMCPTLTANMGTGGHNVPLLRDDKGIRKLTPRECFRLQGFSDEYKLPTISDSELYKLAGNAVSVPIIEIIYESIKSAMQP